MTMNKAALEGNSTKKNEGKSEEDKAGVISTIFLAFLNPLFEKGTKNPIQLADLGPVSTQDDCHLLYIRFLAEWEKERKLPKVKRSLWGVLWRTVGYWRVFQAIGLYLLYCGENFGPVMILNALVKHFDGIKPLSDTTLWILVALIFVLPMAGSIFAAHSNNMVSHMGVQFRNALITMIYRKSLLLSPASRQTSSTGQIVNMFSNDTAQLMRFLYFFNNVVTAPATIAVCLYLIYQQVGAATFVGLGLMIVTMPMNGVVFGVLGELRKKKSVVTDVRVKLMNEILNGIRVIKYYAWESAFQKKILQVREKELVLLKQVAYIIAVFFTLVLQAVPVFMPVLVFYTYAQLGNNLDAATAFTTLSLFNLLQFPFIFLPLGIAQYSQSIVACQRMLDFFDSEELSPYVDSSPPVDDVVISMKNANLSWILEENVVINSAGPAAGGKVKIEDIDSLTSNNKANTHTKANPVSAVGAGKEAKYAVVAASEGDIEMGASTEKPDLTKSNSASTVNRSVKTLNDVNFEIKKGQLVAVVGSVGSGKSSLLSALLGEMNCVSGSVKVHGSIAYCDQRAWILNDTVEGNILFGKAYDEEKFDLAMYSANLEDDVKTLEGGMQTQIGERGINLSGGQKARVALARAIYRDADVYLLDDPLSAVDAHVGQFLFHECIRTTLAGKTRILVTHQVHLLPYCDMVIVIDEGRIKAAGSYADLQSSGVDIEAIIPQSSQPDKTVTEESDSPPKEVQVRKRTISGGVSHEVVTPVAVAETPTVATIPEEIAIAPAEEAAAVTISAKVVAFDDKVVIHTSEASEGASRKLLREKSKADAAERRNDIRESKITTKEDRKEGNVTREAYVYYIKAGGQLRFVTAILFVMGGQVFTLMGSYWLQDWGSANIDAEDKGDPLSTERNIYYLNIFAAWSCAGLMAVVIRSLILANHRLGTSIALHEGMLKSTLFASVAFFDTTPVGRILNRFSSDLLTIDEELSQSLSQVSNSLAAVFGAIGAIAGSTKGTFLILMVPLVFFYNAIQKYFRGTNTEVARLESISRSPIYADFSQALSGVNSIRAYREQQRFIDVLESSVNVNSVANVTQQLASNWLAIRLDFIGSLISFFIAVMAAATGTSFIPAGFLALGLSYSFQLTTYLKFLVRVMATGEAQMNSVERVMHYMNHIDQEGGGERELDEAQIPEDWPSQGVIDAKEVAMRYRDGPLVLKGLDFHVGSNEKIGVAGRTGSGKSSLMIGLFRIQELADGSICIDGIDIATVPLHRLRSKLGIIPQDPVMFSASVRFNLDPFNKYEDAAIWDVLQSINLKDHVLSLPNKLGEEVAEGGDNFSAGQRQLICIARAILRKPKILVLDEATASIDNETDALVQRMVRSEFKNCTVLTIAHRLNTIIDSDKILVLDSGVLAEFDSPEALLTSKPDGIFKGLWDKHQKSHGNDKH